MIVLACGWLTGCGARIDPSPWNANTPVSDVLEALGSPRPPHYLSTPLSPDTILRGHELVFRGRATAPDGAAGQLISAYFVCVDCHLTAREEPAPAQAVDPSARLDWLDQNQLALLPGNTFAGVTDRESWFHGDWQGKGNVPKVLQMLGPWYR